MKIIRSLTAMVLVLATAHQAAATDISWLETRSIGGGFGVQVKESRTSLEELDQIKEAGFGFLRYGISWATVEHEKGVYDWSAYDDFIKEVDARGLRSVIIVAGGNPLYTEDVKAPKKKEDHRQKIILPPAKSEQMAAFAHFAAATAEHYKDQFIIWEIWNEPDLARFWHPKPDAKIFAALATQTCQAIKQADPTAKVMGPATASMPGTASMWDETEFIEPLLKLEASACLDAISFHSYRIDEWDKLKIPETVMDDNRRVQKFITANISEGREKPTLVSSEWGYSLTQGKSHAVQVSPEQQAAYVLRTRFANLLSGVPLSIWYEWRDQQADPTADASDAGAHFGLFTLDKQPKASFTTLNDILPRIRNAKIERSLPTESTDHFLLSLLQPDGSYTLAFWTIREPNDVPDMLEIKQGINSRRLPITSQPQIVDVGSSIPDIAITRGNTKPE